MSHGVKSYIKKKFPYLRFLFQMLSVLEHMVINNLRIYCTNNLIQMNDASYDFLAYLDVDEQMSLTKRYEN